ncbi:MAG: alpha/beta hydrolase [Propionibacteriaceae bacterium]|nr:alpha/beta hydrolase [Propionibacteriaceae bacterium]
MIHPQIAEVLASLPAPPPGPLDPVAMRAGEAAQVPAPADRIPVASVEDADVDGVPVRVYRSDAVSDGTLVYFHGGAFFLGSLDTHDHVARALANATDWTVVSVDYRLAPEHTFPAGLDDCWTVVRWAAGQGGPVALAGDSSGGTFVAALAARAADEGLDAVTHQVLYYPSLDLDFDTTRYESLRTEATGYGLETAGLAPFNAFYLDSGADPDDPRVSPIKRADLTGLPPALVVTAEHDPLRDEGELYARRLAEAGVPVTHTRYEGANHGFVANFGWIGDFARVFDQTAAFLNR